MRRQLLTIPLLATILWASTAQAAPAPASTAPNRYIGVPRAHPDLVLLRRQMAKHPELPPIEFWTDHIAVCETNREWNRGWDWGPNARSWVSGGLGLANVTWTGYGGKRFASKAAFASKWAQIYVANKVGFLGHQTKNQYRTFDDRQNNRPLFRDPAGFDQGWGGNCYKAWVRKHGKP